MSAMLDLLIRDAEEVVASHAIDFEPLKGARVLVSGVTGLIGMHLMSILYVLKREGYLLRLYGQYHNKPAVYTEELATLARISLYHDSESLPISDIVIHAAGYGQPVIFLADPAGTIHVNTTITEKLLQSLAPGGRFLFVSSNEVYHGLQKEFATEEDIGTTTPYNPRAGYIEGKRSGEAITYAYRKSGVNAASARLNLTYGPGARTGDKRALSGFIDQAVNTGHIELKFAGKEKRTCCYARDVAAMLLNVALHGTKPVYNVGERGTTSIAELAGIVARLTGATITVPADDNELPGSHALPRMDISQMETDLGMTDYLPLEEGLRRTIEWHRGLNGSF
jgi:nucleoside-diphosphate-sugar epimerase